VSEKSLKVPKG